MSVVYDKGVNSPLITSWSKFKKMAQKYNLTPMKWDGNVSKLKRGDILVYKKPTVGSNGAGQHTFIYLGKNLVAEGSRRKHYYGHIAKKTAGRGVLNRKDKAIFFIARAKN